MENEINGSINLGGDIPFDIYIRIQEGSNITKKDIEYLEPFIKNEGKENEIKMPATSMFFTSLCNYVKIPVDSKIKTIEVKNRIFDAGLPGIIVELGNCIETTDIE